MRWNIPRKADDNVNIEGQSISPEKVDSLNVKVAAGLLCEAFCWKPSSATVVVNEASDTLALDVGPGRNMVNMLF